MKRTARTAIRSRDQARRFVDRVTEHPESIKLPARTFPIGAHTVSVGMIRKTFTGLEIASHWGGGLISIDTDEEFFCYVDEHGSFYAGKRKRSQGDGNS